MGQSIIRRVSLNCCSCCASPTCLERILAAGLRYDGRRLGPLDPADVRQFWRGPGGPALLIGVTRMKRLFGLVACALLVVAAMAHAQGVQTGTITGIVQSSDGLSLPGVTVT